MEDAVFKPMQKCALKRLRIQGILSFGREGVDLEFRQLNVLIGPNGSGKSNLLEVLSILKAAPRNLTAPIHSSGDAKDWLWKGRDSLGVGMIEAALDTRSLGGGELAHRILLNKEGSRVVVAGEEVERRPERGEPVERIFAFTPDSYELRDRKGGVRSLSPGSFSREESVLSQIKDADFYPGLSVLERFYEELGIYRSWCFGPGASIRREQSPLGRSDMLVDGGENLALVFSSFSPALKRELVKAFQQCYPGIVWVDVRLYGGVAQLLVEEADGRQIPAMRLSDGTLRFLSILVILLNQTTPSLIVIDEPDLGLHADMMPTLAELLREASKRTQVVVTTHSRALIDAFGADPEAVVVCEKPEGESRFERLDGERLSHWLDRYSLGELWASGELGGNRW